MWPDDFTGNIFIVTVFVGFYTVLTLVGDGVDETTQKGVIILLITLESIVAWLIKVILDWKHFEKNSKTRWAWVTPFQNEQ